MKNTIDIENVIRNTRRYWFVDGIAEISGGALISFIALSYYLTSLISNVVIKSILLGLGQPVIILLGAFAIRKIITWLKDNITYPRTGYLSYHNPPENRRVKRIIKVVFVACDCQPCRWIFYSVTANSINAINQYDIVQFIYYLFGLSKCSTTFLFRSGCIDCTGRDHIAY